MILYGIGYKKKAQTLAAVYNEPCEAVSCGEIYRESLEPLELLHDVFVQTKKMVTENDNDDEQVNHLRLLMHQLQETGFSGRLELCFSRILEYYEPEGHVSEEEMSALLDAMDSDEEIPSTLIDLIQNARNDYEVEDYNVTRCEDNTLTIWGYGNGTQFSEMIDVELGNLIITWKQTNPELKTVELIDDNYTSIFYNAQANIGQCYDYVSRVKKYIRDRGLDIKIKTLPIGSSDMTYYSSLWIETETFLYNTVSDIEKFEPLINSSIPFGESLDTEYIEDELEELKNLKAIKYTKKRGHLNDFRDIFITVKAKTTR